MKNKFEKFLLGMSSVFLLAIIVLGFKVENDNKRIAQILENLNANDTNNNNVISQTREQILNQVANAPAQDVEQNVETKTIVPGKVVSKVVPVSTSSKATTTKATNTTKSS